LNLLQAVVLGIVQGLTEFLPVSSSGHLVMGETLLGLETPGVVFETTVHVATLVAVCWVYRARIGGLILGVLRRDPDSLRYAGLLFLASVPVGFVGLTMADAVESAFDRPVAAAAALLVTGAFVWTLRRTGPRAERQRPRPRDALGIGVAQAFAILPGISRSGTTLAAGTALGVEPARMAEFSFLMSVPAIAGAAVLQLPELGAAGAEIGASTLAAGFVSALVAGVAAIAIFLRMLRARSFHRFAYYCWVVGAAYLVAAWLEPALR
jgi:undecaprenyl-diphosphatase